jgi:hypothetical protein
MRTSGFPPEIGYGIFKNQQIPLEIKEKALFLHPEIPGVASLHQTTD